MLLDKDDEKETGTIIGKRRRAKKQMNDFIDIDFLDVL